MNSFVVKLKGFGKWLLKSAKTVRFWVGLFFLILIILIIASQIHKGIDDRVIEVSSDVTQQLTDEELQEQALIEAYGEPPTGFEWTSSGQLVAIGDTSLTPEDVGYTFLRSLSQLDFSSASKYSSNSIVCSNYDSMYTNQSISDSAKFSRNIYKEVLLSLVVNDVENMAVFADSSYVISFSVTLIDLTNKDFWLSDAEEIFENLDTYAQFEGDTTKASQYLFDYLLDYYSSEDVLTRTVTIDLVLEGSSTDGWLVTNDADLDDLCRYTNGAEVSDYIWSSYDTSRR